MPANHMSYVPRRCDKQLLQGLEEGLFTAVVGDHGLGKSSLLIRTHSVILERKLQACCLDLQGARTDRADKFLTRFFELIARRLGRVEDWFDLADAAKRAPLTLFLDEFGHLTTPVAQQVIPGLHNAVLSAKGMIKVAVSLPTSIERFLSEREFTNPKYFRGWMHVEVPCFSTDHVDSLLSLLPDAARRLAAARIERIVQLSNLHPEAVQRVCYRLFEAAKRQEDDGRLASVLECEASYQ